MDSSYYVTEGCLRASHRSIVEPTFDNLGLPYHRSFKEDIEDLLDESVELVFDLLPTSNIFDKGHRIRVTITCADVDNTLTPKIDPPPEVYILRNQIYPSHIVLPIIE